MPARHYFGPVAQWESAAFASQKSGVQIPLGPPAEGARLPNAAHVEASKHDRPNPGAKTGGTFLLSSQCGLSPLCKHPRRLVETALGTTRSVAWIPCAWQSEPELQARGPGRLGCQRSAVPGEVSGNLPTPTSSCATQMYPYELSPPAFARELVAHTASAKSSAPPARHSAMIVVDSHS